MAGIRLDNLSGQMDLTNLRGGIPMRIAAFDLDGTLIRGQSAAEAIAEGIGRAQQMREMARLLSSQIEEARASIEEMATWYTPYELSDLCDHLKSVSIAPGVDEGLALLHENKFKIAIVSLTWDFAADWFANRLGADYSVGTGLSPDGRVTPFWPQDKALWLTGLADRLGVDMRDVAAVGDSRGDIPMLLAAGHRGWVSETIPPELENTVIHEPEGDILQLAHRIVDAVHAQS